MGDRNCRHASRLHGDSRYDDRQRCLAAYRGHFAASNNEATWVLTSYLVANGIVLTISGWLSAVIGRKRYFLICLSMFTVCSPYAVSRTACRNSSFFDSRKASSAAACLRASNRSFSTRFRRKSAEARLASPRSQRLLRPCSDRR